MKKLEPEFKKEHLNSFSIDAFLDENHSSLYVLNNPFQVTNTQNKTYFCCFSLSVYFIIK